MKDFHWLQHGPYPCNIGFTTSRRAFRAELRKHKLPMDDGFAPEAGARTWAITKRPWVPFYIVCIDIRPQSRWQKIVAQLAHEAVHVAQYLWEQIGEERPGDEAEAYFVEWLVEQMADELDMPERGTRTAQSA